MSNPIPLQINGVKASEIGSITPKTIEVPQPIVDDKLKNRAELLRVYAGLLGGNASLNDLIETMRLVQGEADSVDITHMSQALDQAGLTARVSHVAQITNDLWPAIVQMTSGQYILVIAQEDNELSLFDTSCPDNRAYVTLQEFEPYFTGSVLKAEASLNRVAERHGPKDRQAHWFWGAFRPYYRQFSEIILGSFVGNLLAVAVALFSLQVYDRVIPHQSEATLWVLATGAFVALLLEASLKLARARLVDGAGRQIEIGVQKMLLDRLLGMRSDLKGRSPSKLFSAMREFGSVREFFTATSVGTLADIPFVFIFLLLVASIAGNVVFVLILGGILMVLPGFFMQKKMMRLTEEMQGASAKTNRLLQEVLAEIDTVKTQRAEDRYRRMWTELTTLGSMKSSDQRKLSSIMTFWSQGVQQATYISAVIACTYLVFAGNLSVGSIIAVGILTGRTLSPLTQLTGTMSRWGNVKSALDGLDNLVTAPQDNEADRTYLRRNTVQGSFELREVQFRYDDDSAPIVDIPAAILQPGQKIAVLGSNGAGKSTLLKMLAGLYAPTRGTILLDGTDMGQIAAKDLRRLIGYLGQDVRLFSGTLRDNLNLNLLETDDDRLFEALDFAGLGQFVKGHPKGLDLEIQDGGLGLSIGQRQSIGWARLWLQDPAVCLLDEPTAALDQTLEATLISRLETWLADRTAIIATHRVPILALTNRTFIMQNGRMAMDGPRDAVLAHLRSPKGGAVG